MLRKPTETEQEVLANHPIVQRLIEAWVATKGVKH
jgi:hypothetical protein